MEINGNRVHGSGSGDGDEDEPKASGGGYKPGAVAIYHCLPGFILVPLSAGKRVCRRGVWEGNMPACSEFELHLGTVETSKCVYICPFLFTVPIAERVHRI